MVVRPWSRTLFKVVIMAATMCSGVVVARADLLGGMKGKASGIKDRIGRPWIEQPKFQG